MRIIFMGTPKYAVPFLRVLLEHGEEVAAVVTQPDRPVGRRQQLQPPPVKEYALKNNLLVLQPVKVNDPASWEVLKSLNPELIVVVGFGQILNQRILDLPKSGCLNVHFSLLPKYRGASPIQAAIMDDQEKTGVSTIYMAQKIDSGPVILQKEVPIEYRDNTLTLTDKLVEIGVETLKETIKLVKAGDVVAKPQDESQVSFAPLLTKNSGLILWSKTNRQIYNFVRAMYPWPGAFTFYRGGDQQKHSLIIWEAQEADEYAQTESLRDGTIIEIVKSQGFVVKCLQGAMLVTRVQGEGSKVMPAYDFVIGHGFKKGDILE